MRTLRLAILLVPLSHPLGAQTRDTTRLKDLIVTASRVPEPRSRLGSSADRLEAAELERRQLTSLRQALELLPGAAVVPTGAPGGIASYFLRGAASSHTLFLVDGLRLNDANAGYAAFLGGADLAGIGTVEVVRGPQSTLYGGAALGGVVSVESPRGAGPWRVAAEAEGGSFATWRTRATASGASGRLGLSAAVTANGTENQRRPNDWHQRTQTLRADLRLTDRVRAGATFRGFQQDYTSPGDLRTSNTTPSVATDYDLAQGTAWIGVTPLPSWDSRLLAGAQEHRLASSSQYNGGPEFTSRARNTRRAVDWQNTVRIGPRFRLVAGLNREWSTMRSDADTLEERLLAGYADAALQPLPAVTLSAGFRTDDYRSFGRATTWRATAAWLLPGDTRLHASFGTGFMPPSLIARFGSAFERPNPDIRPERSRGFDVGVEQAILGGRGRLGATWFLQRFRDLIVYQGADFPALGQEVNIERARTSGLELSGQIGSGPIEARAAYTLLAARNLTAPDPGLTRLIRRPRHTASADIRIAPAGRFSLGAGVLAVADREDSDFNAFPAPRVDPGDYAIVRLYGSAVLARGIHLGLRIENLLDRRYEPVYGFPALGRSATASLGADF
jgi:vitamin B12 transporter